MQNKFAFVGLLIFIISCQNPKDTKYRKQFDTVHDLLTALAKKDSITIRRMIGVEKLKDIGEDDEGLQFKINNAAEDIRLFGIPDEDKFTIKEYPLKSYQLIDVTIPVFQGRSGDLVEAKIIVSFVKFLPPNKILDFAVVEKNSEEILTAPTDSAELKK